MDAQTIKNLIETNISGTQAMVDTSDNVHFNAIVISDAFNEIPSRLKRQQMVYQFLNPYIQNGEIHALQLKTYTPEKWAKIKE
jgi:acid stress-induced BolA-like protein IbaG/YrbA